MDTLVSENRVIMNFLDNFLSKFMFGVANRNVSFMHTKHKFVVVSYKRKYVHKVLVNCLFKLTQEKVWLGELTVPP